MPTLQYNTKTRARFFLPLAMTLLEAMLSLMEHELIFILSKSLLAQVFAYQVSISLFTSHHVGT